jgi:hypothetical protein
VPIARAPKRKIVGMFFFPNVIVIIRGGIVKGGEVIIRFVLRENPVFLSYFSF